MAYFSATSTGGGSAQKDVYLKDGYIYLNDIETLDYDPEWKMLYTIGMNPYTIFSGSWGIPNNKQGSPWYVGSSSTSHIPIYIASPVNLTGYNKVIIEGNFINRWVCRLHVQNNTSFGENSGRYTDLSGNKVEMNISDLNGNYYIGVTGSTWNAGTSALTISRIYLTK